MLVEGHSLISHHQYHKTLDHRSGLALHGALVQQDHAYRQPLVRCSQWAYFPALSSADASAANVAQPTVELGDKQTCSNDGLMMLGRWLTNHWQLAAAGVDDISQANLLLPPPPFLSFYPLWQQPRTCLDTSSWVQAGSVGLDRSLLFGSWALASTSEGHINQSRHALPSLHTAPPPPFPPSLSIRQCRKIPCASVVYLLCTPPRPPLRQCRNIPRATAVYLLCTPPSPISSHPPALEDHSECRDGEFPLEQVIQQEQSSSMSNSIPEKCRKEAFFEKTYACVQVACSM